MLITIYLYFCMYIGLGWSLIFILDTPQDDYQNWLKKSPYMLLTWLVALFWPVLIIRMIIHKYKGDKHD